MKLPFMNNRDFLDGPSAKDFFGGPVFKGCPMRESVVGAVWGGCGHGGCALREGVVCRKVRMPSSQRLPSLPV